MNRTELDALAPALDAAVEADPAIDPVCSRSAWQLSFHDAFAPERPLFAAHDGDDWVTLAEQETEQGLRYLEPLEGLWGFAAALVGADAGELLAEALSAEPRIVVLRGMPSGERRLAPLLRLRAQGRFGTRNLGFTTRYVASLEGGLDGWLSRRRPAFRRNLRAAERRVAAEGLTFRRVEAFEPCEQAALYSGVLEVERRTWKAAEGNGVHSGPMRTFYAGMWPRLAAAGQLRVLLAERDGEAVGYLHGALIDGRFRGLQVSFDDAYSAAGLGNVLQLEMLRWLCDTGAREYDLGSYSAYKRRWAEDGLTTMGLLLQPVR